MPKLDINDSITTDPFTILSEQKGLKIYIHRVTTGRLLMTPNPFSAI